ncbi:hypothetical protein [Epibacterium ulvae]|uniref:hypothetical protein n=1 Tax=Epibacterium ulvae TaxID=1156985 RepID=UPI0024937EB0|nr:hypothetical protein [Epibacterium ulvae]
MSFVRPWFGTKSTEDAALLHSASSMSQVTGGLKIQIGTPDVPDWPIIETKRLIIYANSQSSMQMTGDKENPVDLTGFLYLFTAVPIVP